MNVVPGGFASTMDCACDPTGMGTAEAGNASPAAGPSAFATSDNARSGKTPRIIRTALPSEVKAPFRGTEFPGRRAKSRKPRELRAVILTSSLPKRGFNQGVNSDHYAGTKSGKSNFGVKTQINVIKCLETYFE